MKNLTKILISALLMLTMELSIASCDMGGNQSGEFYIDSAPSITMQVGETLTLEVVKSDNLKGKINWTADDDFVFVEDGVVVAAAEGITVVRATLGDYTDKVIVTVTSPKNNTGSGSGNNNTGNNTGNNNTGNNTGNNGGNDNTDDSGSNNNTGNNGGSTVAGLIGSLDFSTTAQRTSWSIKTQVWENGGVKLTNDKGAGGKSDLTDTSNPLRLFKHTDVIIECNGMTKIVFNCPAVDYADYATALANATYNGATITVDGSVATITFASPVNSFSLTLDGDQVRVNSIEIYGN